MQQVRPNHVGVLPTHCGGGRRSTWQTPRMISTPKTMSYAHRSKPLEQTCVHSTRAPKTEDHGTCQRPVTNSQPGLGRAHLGCDKSLMFSGSCTVSEAQRPEVLPRTDRPLTFGGSSASPDLVLHLSRPSSLHSILSRVASVLSYPFAPPVYASGVETRGGAKTKVRQNEPRRTA